jgi:hypothetical protein
MCESALTARAPRGPRVGKAKRCMSSFRRTADAFLRVPCHNNRLQSYTVRSVRYRPPIHDTKSTKCTDLFVRHLRYTATCFGPRWTIIRESKKNREILRSVDHASRYNRVKKNQLDAQLILSIFRQLLHVSGVSRPIIRRYSRTYTTFGTIPIQPGLQTII